MRTTVLSVFEGGYQPNTALSAVSYLRGSGQDANLVDIYVEGFEPAVVATSDLVAISIPLFDSLTTGVQVAAHVREANPEARIVYFGQYATLFANELTRTDRDFCIKGEWEVPLYELSSTLDKGASALPDAIVAKSNRQSSDRILPLKSRDHFRVPDRTLAPDLTKYPQPQIYKLLGHDAVVGGVEATRGCRHKCTYCSVFASYGGKVFVVDEEIVLQDVRNLVASGMTHLSFTDAEFFNAKHHGPKLINRIHDEFPHLTFDFTTRIDHIVRQQDVLADLAQSGVRFITSALEFPKQEVLDEVRKEITVSMIDDAIRVLKSIEIRLNPTFIMFNPWIGLDDLARFDEFVSRNDLDDIIDPVQYETRLLLYKGSPLLSQGSIRNLELTEREFHFDWVHPDPRVDELFAASITPVEEGTFKRCCLKC